MLFFLCYVSPRAIYLKINKFEETLAKILKLRKVREKGRMIWLESNGSMRSPVSLVQRTHRNGTKCSITKKCLVEKIHWRKFQET